MDDHDGLIDDHEWERQYCLKHGIEYIPPPGRGSVGKPKNRDWSLRPLVPSDSFVTTALMGTVDDVTTQETVNGLMALHRGPDGWVPFYRRHNGHFESVASVKVSEIPEMIPGMIGVLADDGFAALNTMYGPGRGQSKLVPGARAVRRSRRDVRWLNACLVDLDVGREGDDGPKGLTIGQAVGALIDAQDNGIIPPVSIYARSGRGLYAMWCLCADDGNAQPGMKWAVSAAERVNRELARRLSALAADRRAVDAARIIRIPGTRHSIVGTKAQYWIAAGPDGQGIQYSLKQLSAALELPPPIAPVTPKTLPSSSTTPRDPQLSAFGRQGNRLLWQQRYNEVWGICEAIGGFPQGRRRICITLMGLFGYRSGLDHKQVGDAMRAVAKRCRPPYPSTSDDMSIDDMIDSVISGKHGFGWRLSKQFLGEVFQVFTDTARQLCLTSLVPPSVAEEIRQDEQLARDADNAAREDAGLRIVQQWIKRTATYPTGKQFMAELTKAGWPVKQRTAYNILATLKDRYPLPKSGERRGRPKKYRW